MTGRNRESQSLPRIEDCEVSSVFVTRFERILPHGGKCLPMIEIRGRAAKQVPKPTREPGEKAAPVSPKRGGRNPIQESKS